MTRDLPPPIRPLLRGIHAATTLPFTPDGRIDEAGFARQLAHILPQDGITGLLVNGHAGENYLTSDAEKAWVVQTAKAAAPAHVAIISGIYAESSAMAAEQARILTEAGADALLVFPCFAWATGAEPDAILSHHRAIAAASDLPMMLYIAPVGAGRLHYDPAVLAALLALPGVAGIKDGSWEVVRSEQVRNEVLALRDDVMVFGSGDEHLMVNYLTGTEGSQVSLAAVIPAQICALWAASEAGDWERARALHGVIQPLARLIYSKAPASRSVARLKACQKMLGLIERADVRSPLCAATDDELPELKRALDAALAL